MTRIPRNQATGLEVIAAFIGVGVLIAFMPLVFLVTPAEDVNQFSLALIAGADFSATYLVMTLLMPTWGVVGLETSRLRTQAERFAGWWGGRHPLREQRMECLVRAAYLAWDRGDGAAANRFAVAGLATAGEGLDRPSISFYYALCLEVRAWTLQKQGRYQEALEQYGRAIRLNLQPPSLTSHYYAAGSAALFQLGRFEEALLFARQAGASTGAESAEGRVRAHQIAALALDEMGEADAAQREIEAAKAIRVSASLAAFTLIYEAWTLWRSGRCAEAHDRVAALQPFQEIKAGTLGQELREVQGRIFLGEGKLEGADAAFQASLQASDGQNGAALYYLSLVSARKGDGAQAELWRERLLREAPESFYAARVRGEEPSGV